MRFEDNHMPLEPDLLKPLERSEGRTTAVDVHDTLRTSILSGRLKPGTILSQVEVARVLKVSRTPVREAMRMLQEGGLIVGQPNFRSCVLGFSPKDIEALYMKRVSLEALGVVITVRRMSPALLKSLQEVINALEGKESHASFSKWITFHREFHRLIVSESGAAFVAELRELELRSERYQSVYKGEHPVRWWQRGEKEHRAVFDAMTVGDAQRAAELAARHIARTALELLAALAPEFDTSGVRTSLNFAISGAAAHERRGAS
jgi:DNA-binding GntR family transcriptional regulator